MYEVVYELKKQDSKGCRMNEKEIIKMTAWQQDNTFRFMRLPASAPSLKTVKNIKVKQFWKSYKQSKNNYCTCFSFDLIIWVEFSTMHRKSQIRIPKLFLNYNAWSLYSGTISDEFTQPFPH